jgi:glycosyltransferase involved in cell wall biosynthesis
MRIAFLLGRVSTADHGDVDPEQVFTENHRALTGSESSLFYTARALAERGHEVTIYCRSQFEAAMVDGIMYRHPEAGVDTNHDAYVALSEPDMLRGAPAGRRICWQQQNNFDYAEEGYDADVDLYVALSPAHREHLIARTKTPADKWAWLPNSIDTTPFNIAVPAARRPHSVAWTSSADRGLHHLLHLWPEVRAQVPDATLRIYYRFDAWLKKAQAQKRANRVSARAAYINECLRRLGRNGENGVIVVDAVPRPRMIRELLQTEVFAYPCDPAAFTEGFGVAVLDACAAGCYPIISDADALGDVYKYVADIIPGRPADRRGRWVAEIVRALTDRTWWYSNRVSTARTFAGRFDFKHVAELWERLLTGARHTLPATVREFIGQGEGTTGIAGRYKPKGKALRLDFVLAPSGVFPRYGGREFDPNNLLTAPRGLSGTDVNLFGSAFAMARRGHDVTVFSTFAQEGAVDGVKFRQFERFAEVQQPAADAAIAHYDAAALRDSKARCNVVVQHTIRIPSPEFYKQGRVDLSLSPSHRNMRELQALHGGPGHPWNVLWNANDIGTFLPHAPIPGRLVFHTSPERGLHRLLAALPAIKARVPEAHLVVIADLEPLAYFHQLGPAHAAIANQIHSGLAQQADMITLRPRLSRNDVLRELSQVALFAYPSDPPAPCEVAPVSILDCLRAGVPVVCKPADGIEDLFGNAIAVAPTFEAFVDMTVDLLKNPEAARAQATRGHDTNTWTFDDQAAALEDMLHRQLETTASAAPAAAVLSLPAYGGR